MLTKYRCYLLALLSSVVFSANGKTNHINEVKLSFIGDKDSQAFMGLKQGIDEANAQGLFLGQHYLLTKLTNSSTAIFTTVNAKHIAELSKAYPNNVIFNLTAEDNDLRSDCLPNVLHMTPSQAMKEDAENQWHKKYTNSLVKAQTWHYTFKKYAAGQLNSRFTRSTNYKMTDTAWAGWASVKLLSDSIARNEFTDTTSILKFLKSDLAFDGQKGMSLSFRETGQLRQPLLLIDNEKIAGEAPVRGVVNTTNLDSLGLTHCPK